jgi:uncharacterized damage-inducible protein DinB
MTFIESFQKELEREAVTTRKMLERVPAEKFDWKPHEKSMSLKQLAVHVAEIPTWLNLVLTTSEVDFADNSWQPKDVADAPGLMDFFERSLVEGRTALTVANDEQLKDTWTMRSGEQVFACDPKDEVLRGCFCQVVHHRAQLGVYLRLLNVAIPGSYGPSADDQSF